MLQMLLSFLAVLFCSAEAAWGAPDCIEKYDPTADYFPHKIQLQYAEHFSVEYFKHYKIVTVSVPWPDAEEAVRYLLVQCGTPNPQGYESAQRIEIPVRRLAAMSTTQLPHLELLDVFQRLIAVSDIEMVHSQVVHERFATGALAEIGHGAGVNLELVLALETDLVMTVASAQSQYNAHPVLEQAGVGVAINAEYTEPSLLGRSEWLKFTAAFFNAEAMAQKRFAHIAAQYSKAAALTRNIVPSDRPTVYVGSLWRDTWHVSGGKSYVAQLITAAGGRYLWSDNESRQSLPLDFEAVYAKAYDADFWITTRNEWHDLPGVVAADERYGDFAAFKNSQVYNANARLSAQGGNDYWESAIVEPHLVLADYIKILHPNMLPDHALKYYKRLD